MSGLISILETLVAEVDAGRAAAVCTVVARRGSAPQVPGATMLVRADGGAVGTVGGGAPEARVQRRASELLRTGGSDLLELSLDEDYDEGEALRCGGAMSVGIMPIDSADVLAPFRAALDAGRRHEPAHVPIVIEHEGRRRAYRLHVEVSPTLLMAGAGHVGQAVARLAAGLGFHVVAFDDRAELASRERLGEDVEAIVDDVPRALGEYPIDGGCYVVIATRGHQHDREALEAVIRRPAAYIGMIASKRKAAAILNALAEAGIDRESLARVHTPIGLPIGAQTVDEIAVSIMAEVIQTRRSRTPKLIEGPIAAT